MIQYYIVLILPAEVAVSGVLVHGLNTEMIVSLLAASVCRLDLQLIRSINKFWQTFLRREREGKTSVEGQRERGRLTQCVHNSIETELLNCFVCLHLN